MLARRLRPLPNISPALAKRLAYFVVCRYLSVYIK